MAMRYVAVARRQQRILYQWAFENQELNLGAVSTVCTGETEILKEERV